MGDMDHLRSLAMSSFNRAHVNNH